MVAANESAIVLIPPGMSPEPPENLSRFLHSSENLAVEVARLKYIIATIELKIVSCKSTCNVENITHHTTPTTSVYGE